MAHLQIELQEGFYDDHVIITVDDKVVFDESSVTTRQQIGLAKTVPLELDKQTAEVRIALPEKNLSEDVKLILELPVYLYVNLARDEKKIILEPRNEPGKHA